MKKKVISMLLAVSMISTSPIYAAEFSDGNSVVVNDAGTVNGTDADSADSAEIPDTSLFSSDAVDGAGVVNDSVDAGEDSAENAFSDQEVPDVDDGSGSGVDAAEIYGIGNDGRYDYKKYVSDSVLQVIPQIISEAGITDQNTDLEKICMITAWFKKNTVYSSLNERGNQSPYGALVLRRAVCAGFATGLSTLLSYMGIDNCVRDTNADNATDNHAWVEVKLNNKFYILDVTSSCYRPGSFLEDYNGFWFKTDAPMSGQSDCGSEFASRNIPASNVRYLGANGNNLYVKTSAGYYVNDGTGWKLIDQSSLPEQIYGSADFSESKEIENIVGDVNSLVTPIVNGKKRVCRFYITNTGAAYSKTMAESLSCSVDNAQIASAEITERGDGWVDVTITGNAVGNASLSVSAPNGVSSSLKFTISTVPVPNITVTTGNGNYNNGSEDSIKVDLNGASEKDYCVDGYQLYVYNEKTGKYKKEEDTYVDGDNTYWFNCIAGTGESKQFKVRAFVEDDAGERIYGDFSDIVTVAPKLAPIKLNSAKTKGKRKISIEWELSGLASYSYLIYRKDGVDGKYKKIKTISGDRIPDDGSEVTSYVDKKLKKGVKYYYKIKVCFNSNGKKVYSKWSNVKSRTCK